MADFESPRGMRDFYPEDMKLRNRIFDAWRAAAVASGFEPYDACVVESLELLQRKAGEEIVVVAEGDGAEELLADLKVLLETPEDGHA